MRRILVAALSYDRDRGGGGVRLAYELASGLALRGHQVSVVCQDLHGRRTEHEIVEGVTVLRYSLPAASGIPLRRHQEHILATAELTRKYLPEQPQVVHGHSLFQYVAVMREYAGSAHFCYTIHSPFVEELRLTWGAQGPVGWIKQILGLPIIRRLEMQCLHESAVLTADSDYTRGLIADSYGSPLSRRVITIPGWVDLNRFRPFTSNGVEAARRQLGWPTDRPIFFVVRRLEARMGLDNLLRALHVVRGRGHRVHTYVGGSGSQLTRLLKLRGALDLENDVTFLGFVSGEILPLAYAACDASVIPTAQLECFGIIALEALACGRPTLVTRVGALPEVMRNFEPQWIARGSSSEAIAEVLCRYLDGKLPDHSPSALREILSERFSFARAMARYEQILIGRDGEGTE